MTEYRALKQQQQIVIALRFSTHIRRFFSQAARFALAGLRAHLDSVSARFEQRSIRTGLIFISFSLCLAVDYGFLFSADSSRCDRLTAFATLDSCSLRSSILTAPATLDSGHVPAWRSPTSDVFSSVETRLLIFFSSCFNRDCLGL